MGSSISPPGPYSNNVNAWMVTGPFSLADATSAKVDFWFRSKSEFNYDYLDCFASTNGNNFYGTGFTGDFNTWQSYSFDLTSVYTLGNLCGSSQVWVAFVFRSDSSNGDMGAFVDDISISKYASQSADLTPGQHSGWNDNIPVGTTQLSGSSAHAYTGPYDDSQTLYFNWASLNQGTATASNYNVHAEVTGTGGGTFDWNGISTDPGYVTYLTNDRAVGPLAAGQHTFKVWLDSTSAVSESNEGNNYYERTITVGASNPTGEIHGAKWSDLDGDGAWDSGEPGLANWKIYIDSNGNGQWDTGEPSQLTDSTGNYAFTALAAGTYAVGEVQQSGWTQTCPGGPSGTSGASSASATAGPATTVTAKDLDSGIIEVHATTTGPTAAVDTSSTIAVDFASSAVTLDVPTSTWTYGCTATSAGMLFGYYDRHGYPTCTPARLTAALRRSDEPGTRRQSRQPDCRRMLDHRHAERLRRPHDARSRGRLLDFLHQHGARSLGRAFAPITPGAAASPTLWARTSGSGTSIRTARRIPTSMASTAIYSLQQCHAAERPRSPAGAGLPQTEACHGMRLFAESRGYTVTANYTQKIDTKYSGGFSFATCRPRSMPAGPCSPICRRRPHGGHRRLRRRHNTIYITTRGTTTSQHDLGRQLLRHDPGLGYGDPPCPGDACHRLLHDRAEFRRGRHRQELR